MIKSLKEISKDTLIYGLGQGLNGLVSFVMLPVYSRFLTPSDYGILSMFEVLRILVTMLIGFGISSALFRYYYASSDAAERKRVVSTAFWILVFISLVVMAAVLPFRRGITRLLVDREEFSTFFILTVLSCLLFNVVSFQMYISRVHRKPVNFMIVQVILTALKLGLNILFVVYLRMNFAGVIYGNFLSTAAVSVVFIIIWVPRNITFELSPQLLRKMITFSIPILITNLIFYAQNSLDRFFIKSYLNMEENGLYSFGNKIGSIVFMSLITAFKTAWPPYAMSVSRDDNCRSIYASTMETYAALALLATSVVAVFRVDAVRLLGHGRYDASAAVVFLVAYGYLFRGLEYGVGIGIDLAYKTYLSTVVELSAALVSVGLNVLLIPRLGIQGAAVSFCASNLLLFALMVVFSQKNYFIPYRYLAFLSLLILNAAAYFAGGIPFLAKLGVVVALFLVSAGIVIPVKTWRSFWKAVRA